MFPLLSHRNTTSKHSQEYEHALSCLQTLNRYRRQHSMVSLLQSHACDTQATETADYLNCSIGLQALHALERRHCVLLSCKLSKLIPRIILAELSSLPNKNETYLNLTYFHWTRSDAFPHTTELFVVHEVAHEVAQVLLSYTASWLNSLGYLSLPRYVLLGTGSRIPVDIWT